jgi:protein SCO1
MRDLFALLALGLAIVSSNCSSAFARVSAADYGNVGASSPANASVPLAIRINDAEGNPRPLSELISQPTVLLFADYTCHTLCGPVVAFVASALEQSGLRAGDQFRLLVIGLDPKDSMVDAARMRQAHITKGSPLDRATEFVTADQATIQLLTSALNYRYYYDAPDDNYVHPAAAYVLDSSGRVARILTGLGLSAADMRLALIEASAGKIGGFRDQVRLLCSAFDPVHGTYDLVIRRVLEIATLVTILVLGGTVTLLFLMGRRRAA